VGLLGSKGKKPISVMEKRQKRLLEGEKEKKTKEEKKPKKAEKYVTLSATLNIDASLYAKIGKEIGELNVITPAIIAQKYSIPVSLAKAVLRNLEREGAVTLVARSRRSLIYVPQGTAAAS
jgi:small subunit ribosomal protein S25e